MGSDNMDENMAIVLRTGLFAERVRRHEPMSPQPEDILQWATMGSARALGLADRVGSLEVGKRADLFVVDAYRPNLVPNHRIVSAFVHNGQSNDIEAVMVDGNWLMKDWQAPDHRRRGRDRPGRGDGPGPVATPAGREPGRNLPLCAAAPVASGGPPC